MSTVQSSRVAAAARPLPPACLPDRERPVGKKLLPTAADSTLRLDFIQPRKLFKIIHDILKEIENVNLTLMPIFNPIFYFDAQDALGS